MYEQNPLKKKKKVCEVRGTAYFYVTKRLTLVKVDESIVHYCPTDVVVFFNCIFIYLFVFAQIKLNILVFFGEGKKKTSMMHKNLIPSVSHGGSYLLCCIKG